MNLSTNKSFRAVQGAVSAYQTSITNALNKYKVGVDRATTESKQYKSENEYLMEKKTACAETARAEIGSARETLKSTVQGEIDNLKSELADHLAMRPNNAFLDTLRVYKDYGLEPSRMEIEGLVKLNGGAMLGYRALNKTLDDAHSRYRVDIPTVDDYEGDIDLLESISSAPLWCDTDHFHELVDLFDGAQREGEIHGITWDRTGLLLSRGDFDSKVKSLPDMEVRWNTTVTPSLRTVELYTNDENGTPAEKLTADIKAVPDAATIEHSESEGVEQARLMGMERAAADARSAEILNLYSR